MYSQNRNFSVNVPLTNNVCLINHTDSSCLIICPKKFYEHFRQYSSYISFTTTILYFNVILYQDYVEGKNHTQVLWRIAVYDGTVFIKTDETQTKITWCLYHHIFKILEDVLKFEYELIRPFTTSFGYGDENGNWDGMIGQLVNNEADFIPFPLFLTIERYEVLQYTSANMFQSVHFLTRTGDKKSNWDSIIKPFSFKVFIITFTT
ncbi:glutamate receptor ionotropic, kainate glr-3-like [Centruroides vittatus]|uniref:glutamate receptor ionotropic, kainate glr-3-like n=1 Tax=Centruroides vittatus TaxID=120091 RepID=UPI00350FE203